MTKFERENDQLILHRWSSPCFSTRPAVSSALLSLELLYCLSLLREAACNCLHIQLCGRWISRSIRPPWRGENVSLHRRLPLQWRLTSVLLLRRSSLDVTLLAPESTTTDFPLFSSMSVWGVSPFLHSAGVDFASSGASYPSTCLNALPLRHVSYLLSWGTW